MNDTEKRAYAQATIKAVFSAHVKEVRKLKSAMVIAAKAANDELTILHSLLEGDEELCGSITRCALAMSYLLEAAQ